MPASSSTTTHTTLPYPSSLHSLTPVPQFGMYILFPIGIMYYFGTNLDGKFTVPDFWPKAGQTHKIPYERDEIKKELERLKERNRAVKAAQREEEERMRKLAELQERAQLGFQQQNNETS